MVFRGDDRCIRPHRDDSDRVLRDERSVLTRRSLPFQPKADQVTARLTAWLANSEPEANLTGRPRSVTQRPARAQWDRSGSVVTERYQPPVGAASVAETHQLFSCPAAAVIGTGWNWDRRPTVTLCGVGLVGSTKPCQHDHCNYEEQTPSDKVPERRCARPRDNKPPEQQYRHHHDETLQQEFASPGRRIARLRSSANRVRTVEYSTYNNNTYRTSDYSEYAHQRFLTILALFAVSSQRNRDPHRGHGLGTCQYYARRHADHACCHPAPEASDGRHQRSGGCSRMLRSSCLAVRGMGPFHDLVERRAEPSGDDVRSSGRPISSWSRAGYSTTLSAPK